MGDLAFYVSVMKVSEAGFHEGLAVEYRRYGGNVSDRGSHGETLRELLAYLDRERPGTDDPDRLRAIEIGRRYWTRRFWRSTATWSVRCLLAGRFREAVRSARVVVGALPVRLLGGRPA